LKIRAGSENQRKDVDSPHAHPSLPLHVSALRVSHPSTTPLPNDPAPCSRSWTCTITSCGSASSSYQDTSMTRCGSCVWRTARQGAACGRLLAA
jgi:hypothetical protein